MATISSGLAGYSFAIKKGEMRNRRWIKVLACKRGGGSYQSSIENEDDHQRQRRTVKTVEMDDLNCLIVKLSNLE